MDSITNREDTIDSRSVIDRIAELEADREALVDAVSEAGKAVDDADRSLPDWEETTDALGVDLDDAIGDLKDFDGYDDGGMELTKLQAFAEEAEGYTSEWADGAYFIRDGYFEEHAREEAESCGLLHNCDRWPATCIDWKRAADELKMDYSCIEFDGESYWVRST